MQGAWVGFLVRAAKKPHASWPKEKKKKKQNINIRSDIVTNSICSVSQSCPTPCNFMNCSPSGSSVHGIFQAKILEQVAISNSRGSFQPRDQTWVSCVSCSGRWDSLPLHHLGSPNKFNKDFKNGPHLKKNLKKNKKNLEVSLVVQC